VRSAIVSLPPEFQAIVDGIRSAHPQGLTLDELADELSNRPVSFADVEAIIGALEDAAISLDGPAPAASPDELARVLTAARALTAERGQHPSADEIAARTGLGGVAVRRALLLGRALARSSR
jgi:hypothetical protein